MDKNKIYAEEMTLRDYFAGQALAGILAAVAQEISQDGIKHLPSDCYGIADEMMQERDK